MPSRKNGVRMELVPGYMHPSGEQFPQDWKQSPLHTLLTQSATYGVVKAGAFQRFGIPMLRGGDIKGGRINHDLPLISSEKSAEYIRTVLRNKDVVIALVGYPGESAVVSGSLVGANVSRAVGLLRPSQALDSSYLACYLNSDFGRAEFLKPGAGSAQMVVNLKDLNLLSIPLPPTKAEQKAIAEALSDSDALIESLERLIGKKRRLKQGAIQELLTGAKRLPGFSGEWEARQLGDLAAMASGGTPSTSIAAYYNGNIPWVSIFDMTKDGRIIHATDRYLTAYGFSNSAAQMFPPGTVLYAMYASLGECSIAGVELCTSQAILGIRSGKQLDSEFLYYWLTSRKTAVRKMAQHGTQANLNKGMVQAFRLCVPALPEQIAIATVLSDMDTELATLEAKLAKARQLKQGMMQALLTGRIRLPIGKAA